MKNNTSFVPVITVRNSFAHVKKFGAGRERTFTLLAIHVGWLAYALIFLCKLSPVAGIFSLAPTAFFMLGLVGGRNASAGMEAAGPVWLMVVLSGIMLGGSAGGLLLPGLLIAPLMAFVAGRGRLALGLVFVSLIAFGATQLLMVSGFARPSGVLTQAFLQDAGTGLIWMAFALVAAAAIAFRRETSAEETQPLAISAVYLELNRDGNILRTVGRLDSTLDSGRVAQGQPLSALLEDGQEVARQLIQLVPGSRVRLEGNASGTRARVVITADRPTSEGPVRALIRRADDRRDLVAAVEAAQGRLTERTAFFAGLGHDLKTPLNAIIGFSEMMKGAWLGPLSETYQERAALIHESSQDLLLMVEDMLDLAKSEAGQYRLETEPTDPVEVARAVVRQLSDLAKRRGISFEIEDAAPVWAEADPRAVRQILQNLISNAIKYSDENGVVRIGTRKSGAMATVYVADDGEGMSAADLARIAEPFAQGGNSRGHGGTGLGLAVVKTLAELHGGSVMIETAPGAGTHVEVALPLSSHEEDAEDAARAAE